MHQVLRLAKLHSVGVNAFQVYVAMSIPRLARIGKMLSARFRLPLHRLLSLRRRSGRFVGAACLGLLRLLPLHRFFPRVVRHRGTLELCFAGFRATRDESFVAASDVDSVDLVQSMLRDVDVALELRVVAEEQALPGLNGEPHFKGRRAKRYASVNGRQLHDLRIE